VFFSLLLLGRSVCHAYEQATKQGQTRHAWRWLKRLKANLMRYRGYLKVPIPVDSADQVKNVKHHRLLLTTLALLVSTTVNCPCVTFQLSQQTAFI
tara:strand:+ start:904 stop:1191 length:288 start_codon:yes stop_codon:yes gene_type:complete